MRGKISALQKEHPPYPHQLLMFGQETETVPDWEESRILRTTSVITFHFSHLGFSPVKQKKDQNQRISLMHFDVYEKTKYFDHGLQLDGVGCKFADAIRQFLHGHTVFVVLPAERLLIQMNLLQITGLGYTHRHTKLNGSNFHLRFNAAFWRCLLSDRYLSPHSVSPPQCCGPGWALTADWERWWAGHSLPGPSPDPCSWRRRPSPRCCSQTSCSSCKSWSHSAHLEKKQKTLV